MGGQGSGRKPQALGMVEERAGLQISQIRRFLSPGQSDYKGHRLAWTNCNYGGQRPWWLCPKCDRRVAILYCAQANEYSCRKCLKLAYQSTRLCGNIHRQRWHRITLFKLRFGLPLDWDPYLHRHIPPRRPKGMHRSRFQKEVKRFWAAEHDFWLMFSPDAIALLKLF